MDDITALRDRMKQHETARQSWPQCSFYVRIPVGGYYPPTGEAYRYEPVQLGSYDGDGRLHTPNPPVVGDLIHLWDKVKKEGGTYVVIARQWLHSGYGSPNWPPIEPAPKVGPLLDIVVEPAEGVFRNEAPADEDEVTP